MRNQKKSRVMDYIMPEKAALLVITLSGIGYNVGMTAGPWFEGKLAQTLCDILAGEKEYPDMVLLAGLYIAVIFLVQLMRYVKRLYVRKFANHLNRDMKEDLYHRMISGSRAHLEQEGTGSLMTKAIGDVDACVEGIRKFTTEVFDTGVVMLAYLGMLLYYDWRLTCLSMVFPPIAYFLANRLKKPVTQSAAAYKTSAGQLSEATLDRVGNALTYRIYGQESLRDRIYESRLLDYEKKAVGANIWQSVMQPVYLVISMAGSVCILWFGGRNVMGLGWKTWDIAAFVTFLSCFTKLASKSSKAAKLFNSVQKAAVSWKRIRPMLVSVQAGAQKAGIPPLGKSLAMEDVSFHYAGSEDLFAGVSFSAAPGTFVGITGPVACGKSTLGQLLLGELPYSGRISISGQVSYLGHDPELISGTIAENILLGSPGDAWEALSWVCMDEEVRQMPQGIETRIGNGGMTLSGGQQARIALARTLFHRREILVLDDPFSAVDPQTEAVIFRSLQTLSEDRTVLLISHRLSLFPQMDQVLWMEKGRLTASTHQALMETNPDYGALYAIQGGER